MMPTFADSRRGGVEVATVTLNPAIDRTITVAGLRAGAVNRAEVVGERAGGKGVNVAAALAEQGHGVVALGFLGRENAEVFEAFFAAHGVEDACVRVAGATRVGLKIVDPARGETTDLNFPGLAPTAGEMGALGEKLDGVRAEWCVLAGSLPPGVAVDFYARACRRLRARGVRVALDTSGEALAAALGAGVDGRARPDLIKPNVHELAALIGRELADEVGVIAAAREIVASGVGLVAVSRGAEGAVFVTESEVVVARPPRVEVRSTVGAGDAMVAGLVAARLRGLGLAEAARLATAFSLHALTRVGAMGAADGVGVDPREAVAGFAGRVEVEEV
jgi:1-phosphofructokinase